MLIAKEVGSNHTYENIEPADDIVKRVQEDAEYMMKCDYGTLLFYPLGENEKAHFQYEINGKVYKTVWTNKYEDLVKHKKEAKQMSIFDYL